MKHRILAIMGSCLLFFSCKKNETPATEEPPKVAEIQTETGQCYEYAGGKDTITARLIMNGDAVSGKLDYKFFEKDSNTGTLSGVMKGDTLVGDYTFQSEGSTSVRQVAFLRKNGSLTEGYADSEETDGKMVFKKGSPLKFDGKMVLTLVPCR